MPSRRFQPLSFLLGAALFAGCVNSDEIATAEYEVATEVEGMPAIIPVSSFFDNPEIAGAQISPDGEWLSYLKAVDGKLNVFAKRIGTDDEIQLTADTERPVTGYFWSIDASKILYVQDRGGNENFHIYALPVDGTPTPDARDLTPHDGARAQIFAVPEETPDRIFIGMNQRDPQLMDGYWLDLDSGEMTMVAENTGRHLGYMLDHDQKARVAVGQNMGGGTDIFARDDEDAEWRTIASYP
ncbi:MAG: TolB family protein, partial [Gemmatimonadota bacterium]